MPNYITFNFYDSFAVLTTAVAALVAIRVFTSHFRRKRRADEPTTIAFFHIFCNDGGGAERVLWSAIQAIYAVPGWNVRCVIYSGETLPGHEIVANAEKQFGIKINRPVDFVFVRSRNLFQCLRYHRWSLWGLMFGAFIVALEALLRFRPDIMIDTTGHAPAVCVFKTLGQCRVVSYLHWPTITAEDVEAIHKSLLSLHDIPPSALLRTIFQYLMIRVYIPLYAWLGRHADVIMVNSFWTSRHFHTLWGVCFTDGDRHSLKDNVTGKKGLIVYPPCNSAHRSLPMDCKTLKFVAVAQFRPEKNHPLKLEAFRLLLDDMPHLKDQLKLSLVGSARHEEDWVRVNSLKKYVEELNLEDNVEFHVNSTFENLQKQLTESIAGLHTMWNEHFGIGVVELMGGGVVPIAHNSGGPRDDIVRPVDGLATGYLAITAQEYAASMKTVLTLDPEEYKAMQHRARKQSDKFTDEEFARSFVKAVSPEIESFVSTTGIRNPIAHVSKMEARKAST